MPQKITNNIVSNSFRDPSGFVFYRDGILYRQINQIYKLHYNELMESGLYADLVNNDLLIPHKEIDVESHTSDLAFKIIQPKKISLISYPYEWCFSQLKDAALTTLKIQKIALKHNMILKDASAYNIQFLNNKPILIDTLSFEKYEEGLPWIAYKQFCQHFLAPLALMSYKDIRLSQLFRVFIDGIPLDLASQLLPFYSKFNIALYFHIHLQAKFQKCYSNKEIKKTKTANISRTALLGIIDNLESGIKKFKLNLKNTEWGDYYEETNYSSSSFKNKEKLLDDFLTQSSPRTVWDLGSNTGTFSRICSSKGIQTLSLDGDPLAVEKNYQICRKKNETNVLPLLMDLTNPSASIGWNNEELLSLSKRGPADMVLALALIHHLAISNNVPFYKLTNFFASICKWLIIEFVPKEDSQVQKLLSTREDIFVDYNQKQFEISFQTHFDIIDSRNIEGTFRNLYLLKKKSPSKINEMNVNG